MNSCFRKAIRLPVLALFCSLPALVAPQSAVAAPGGASKLVVRDANTAPTISVIANQTIAMNGVSTVNFTIGDAETAAAGLTLTAASESGDVVSQGNIVFDAGSGTSRSATITPTANAFGSSKITITVDDGSGAPNATATAEFVITVSPGNSGSATISGVSPVSGKVNDLVTISGTGLIGPSEGSLSSQTQIWYSTKGVSVSSYGEASFVFPEDGSTATSLIFRVPAGLRTAPLAVTVDVTDATTGITTRSVAVSPSIFVFMPSIDSFTPSRAVAGTLVDIQGGGFTNATQVRFNGVAAVIDFKDESSISTQVPVGATTGPISIVTSDVGTIVSSANFNVGTNIPPTISTVADQTTPMSTLITVNFTVADAETPAADLTVTAVSSDQGLVKEANLVLEGSGANRSVKITPVAGQFGALNIYLRVNDGSGALNQVTETSFRLRINGGTLGNAVINGFTPNHGRPGTVVNITGSGLLGPDDDSYLNTTIVNFKDFSGDWIQAYPEAGSTATNLQVIVPETARTGPLTVTVDTYNVFTNAQTHDIATSAANFTVNAVIDSFSPGLGSAGQEVDIEGTGFLNATAVLFNGVSATITDKTETSITAVVPASASTGVISVVTHDAGTAVSASAFTFVINDPVAPIQAIVAAPVAGSTIPNLNAGISGSARDDASGSGIDQVHVVLGRNREGVDQFWGFNGTTSVWEWSTTARTIAAVVGTPNAIQTNWSLTANLPSGANLTAGAYFVHAVAYDRAGNSWTGANNNFNITSDSTPPSVAVTTPANGAAYR